LARSPAQLKDIATRAHDLLRRHQLPQWGFQFDNGTTRAGCCHYRTQVITLAYEFARRAPAEEITDTLLHEIAHALVGQRHHHDEVWRAKAQAIGCSGRRCHEVHFTPPRYIARCERRCWVATAERRRRGLRCTQCHGKVVYEPYTEERWQRSSKASS